jgi:hypothetical protein
MTRDTLARWAWLTGSGPNTLRSGAVTTTMAVDVRETGPPTPPAPLTRRSMPAWPALAAGAGVLSGQGAACYLYPALGLVLAAVDVIVPLVLLVAILCGSTDTCERVFRLLRWVANRPEPPAPGGTGLLR